MGDRRTIGLSFPSLRTVHENVVLKKKKKKTCPSLNWHCSISSRSGILICSGILSDRGGEKKLQGQQRFTDGELAQDLCRVAFFFHWGRSMYVINRFEVNNLLSRALAILAVVMGGAQGRKPGTLFSWSVTYGSGYAEHIDGDGPGEG